MNYGYALGGVVGGEGKGGFAAEGGAGEVGDGGAV